MKLVQVTFTAFRHDADGTQTSRSTDRVYLRMLDNIAEDARRGAYDLGLLLTIQHIAELQGYSRAQIESIVY